MATNNFDPIKEGATKFDPSAYGATPVKSSIMDNPVAKVVDFIAPAIKKNYNVMANQLNYQNQMPNTKGNLGASISEAAKATGHLATQLPGAALSDAETIFNALGAKALLKGGAQVLTHPVETAKAVAQLPKYLTKGGVANLSERAASKATQEGQYIHWDDLVEQARQKAIKQFGDTAATRQALNNVIAPRTPAGIESIPETLQQTPEQLLQLRRNILSSYGKSLFQPATEKGITALEQKVAGVVRGAVSESLHRLAPETVRPDQLYRLYSKGGPLLAKALKTLGIPAGVIGAVEVGKSLK